MKSNRIFWGFVSLLILLMLAVSPGSIPTHGQETIIKKDRAVNPKPIPPDNRDLSKFGSVQYDSPVSAAPGTERWFANQRYDNSYWVFTSIDNNPRAASVGRFNHDPIADPLPVNESSMIVSGEVVSVTAYLSNDRGSVYTELTIKPHEIFRDSEKLGSKVVTADREGGVVVYPTARRIQYGDSRLGMPQLHGKYVFFLAKKGKSPNYEILASYDIGGRNAYRLELETTGKELEEITKERFLELVRNKIAQSR